MKVKSDDFSNSRPISLEDALVFEMEASTDHGCGQLEQLQADVQLMRNMLAKFMAKRMESVSELNTMTQWRTYTEVK